jgi:Zn-dependent protease
MSARDAWTLFRVGGVPVRIHFTWLFIAAYLWLVFAGQFARLAQAADVSDAQMLWPPVVWGILLTIALFACVLLHELAHVRVARRGGARVRSVTLMMLGGVSEIGEVEDPRLERRMAAAGPLFSIFLAAVVWAIFRLSRGGPPDVRFGLFYLAQMNLVLGVFNLVPAFPLDGGRVLRSLLVPRLGRVRATRVAATVGKVLAAGMVVLAILGGSWWLVLIALFIFLGGEAESRALQTRAALRGLRV